MSFNFDRDLDTICALSTATGRSGIAVVRVSGDKAVEICSRLSKLPEKLEHSKAYYSWFRDLLGNDLDECILTFFEEDRSFTSEKTVEISCHGNPVIVEQILRALVACGARPADRGEFTYRAFMNGRIDLVQAEGILSLIEGQSELATRLSVRQLKGTLSGKLLYVEDRLIWCLAHMQAAIDFSTEDNDYIHHDQLKIELQNLLIEVQGLLATFKTGSLIRNGLRVAILGPPNAGKSSLLNALLDEDRAIVTDVPGTTRDVIEGHLLISGVPVVLLDTAGIRETEDQIEKMGIQRSLGASKSADMILYVYDAVLGMNPLDIQFLKNPEYVDASTPLVFVANKADLVDNHDKISKRGVSFDEKGRVFERNSPQKWIAVSAKSGLGVDSLKEIFLKFQRDQGILDLNVSINSRHFEDLSRMAINIGKVLTGIQGETSPEFVTFDLQEALAGVLRILGKSYDDQVLDRVFKEFCLGK